MCMHTLISHGMCCGVCMCLLIIMFTNNYKVKVKIINGLHLTHNNVYCSVSFLHKLFVSGASN